jgi:hypothetical protein
MVDADRLAYEPIASSRHVMGTLQPPRLKPIEVGHHCTSRTSDLGVRAVKL